MKFGRVSVDPTPVTTDLGDVRAAVNQELKTLQETSTESLQQVLWLTPFTPKRALRRMAEGVVADPDLPVVCSNLGDLGSVVSRADGTAAEYNTARGTRQNASRRWLERIGGQLTVLSGRIPGRIGIVVIAYQPGADNTKPALRKLAARTLAEFGLTAEIE